MAKLYRFGQFVLDPSKRALSRADSPVFLIPRAMDVLIFLAQNPNRLVTKEELLAAVWGDAFVEEGNLTKYISHVRKALDDGSEDSRLIVTIPRKGYQFTGNVTVGEATDIAIQGVVQIPIAEGQQADTLPRTEGQISRQEPKAPKRWRKAVAVAASAVILIAAGYISWRHVRAIAPPPQTKKVMLAVLPFENLTGDPNKEYLADGLTEEMISQLGRLNPEHLGVIARTSVMGYEHSEERLDQIGRDLSVQYVLENSLQQSGDHLRITVQLIEVKDQSHLWSHDYDYRAQDILTVEDDVAKAVAREIQLRLDPQQQAELAQPQPVNPQAFDAYLQGYYLFQRERDRDKDPGMTAGYFEHATQLDPSYALAWAWLSRARDLQARTGNIPREEGNRLAREAVERALALNPNLAAAHAQMWRLKRYVDFDWVGADASIQRAVALDPGNPEYLTQAAISAATFGRSGEALELARRAVELDPLNPDSWENLGQIEYFEDQLAGAEVDVKRALQIRSDVWPGAVLLSEIYVMEGRPQDASPEIERVRSDDLRVYLHALTFAALGRREESLAALKELIANYSTYDAFEIAQAYAFRNERDEAFDWLDRAYAQGDNAVPETNVDPLLKNLHNDPRYAAFLTKIHLPNIPPTIH